jgi:hypothetical protein
MFPVVGVAYEKSYSLAHTALNVVGTVDSHPFVNSSHVRLLRTCSSAFRVVLVVWAPHRNCARASCSRYSGAM